MSGRRLPLLYPVLLALLPALVLAARNPGQYATTDLLGTLAGITLAVTLVLAPALLAGRRLAGERGEHVMAVLVAVAVALFFYSSRYAPLLRWVRDRISWTLGREEVLLPAILAAAIVAAVWLLRRRVDLSAASRFLAVAAALLVAFQTFAITRGLLRTRREIAGSPLVQSLAAPIRITGGPSAARGVKRDIYFVILDEHPNSMVLREAYGVDNHAFDDSLRALGFLVPPNMRSNYIHTSISLPSILNFAHLTSLREELGPRSSDHTLTHYLIEHNRLVRFLKSQGYKFIFLPSSWWNETAHSRYADEEFDALPGLDLRTVLQRTEFRQEVAGMTLLRRYARGSKASALHALRSFERIEQIPSDRAPTLTIAHFLLPHHPFVLGPDCRPLERMVRIGDGSTPEVLTQHMIGQTRCVDRLTLRAVTNVLRRSTVPPVILVMSDHGTFSIEALLSWGAGVFPPGYSRERFGAFGAFYLPDGGDSLFTEPVTTVNVLRNVLVHYFKADLPRRPDALYHSKHRGPFDFRAVDPAVLDTLRVPRSPAAPRQALRDSSAAPAGRSLH